MWGFPSKPGLHWQIGLWFLIVQFAFLPQAQGSLHWRLTQACNGGHSSSPTHPGGDGISTRKESKEFFHWISIKMWVFITKLKGGGFLPGWQRPSGRGTQPSGQIQIIVLKGSVSRTLHLAVTSQGAMTLHGSWQRCLIQASLEGQSESKTHSGSLCSTTGSSGEQLSNGLPPRPGGHLQLAAWFSTKQSAFGAHGSAWSHGLTHCLLTQALSTAQSWLLRHPRRVQRTRGSPS